MNTTITKTVFLLIITFIIGAAASDKRAYLLYDKEGKPASYSAMVKDLAEADIVFFGEQHTDPIGHWLQLELTKDLHAVKEEKLILGAEMFEADDQMIIDEYLAGIYSEKKFEKEVKLWGNFKTDYKPVLDYAKENKLNYIATNIPRRYASVVHKKGFEGLELLSDEAKALISPDLVTLYDKDVACYANMMKMKGMPAHVNENFPKSQASKDATMAYFILKNRTKGSLFLHYHGAYHSDNYEGIAWWVAEKEPKLKLKTITTVYQDDISALKQENIDKAHYIIVVPSSMTRTNR